MENLRSQLDDAAVRTQKMGALQAELASLQEQCQRLQQEKLQAEANMKVRALLALQRGCMPSMLAQLYSMAQQISLAVLGPGCDCPCRQGWMS